jgi:hypothetical protein
VLLDGVVGEVDHLVVQFGEIIGVVEGAEAREPALVDVDLERPIREHQHVDAQVKLLAADKQRVRNVSRANVLVLVGRRVVASLG